MWRPRCILPYSSSSFVFTALGSTAWWRGSKCCAHNCNVIAALVWSVLMRRCSINMFVLVHTVIGLTSRTGATVIRTGCMACPALPGQYPYHCPLPSKTTGFYLITCFIMQQIFALQWMVYSDLPPYNDEISCMDSWFYTQVESELSCTLYSVQWLDLK